MSNCNLVDLGFAEQCESWRLESRFFPSKVGGKPAWLSFKNIPGEQDVACEYCKDPCIFLCQVYAPYEESDSGFHRTVYIFICNKVQCCKPNKNGNIKVFRCQLPRHNEFYPPSPPIEEVDWRTDISVETYSPVCHICGISAPMHCSKCKKTNYCCRAHQLYDWKHGHRDTCGTSLNNRANFLFHEYELVIEPEQLKQKDPDTDESDEDNESEIQKYKTMVENDQLGTLQNEDLQNELMNISIKEDETFSKFRATVQEYPDQVLRYIRNGEILFISSYNKVNVVPRCSECNGERQFEFQIMPQLLNFLGLENALKSIDWGIIAVFTCSKFCVSSTGYCAEYAWKQDIIEETKDSDVNSQTICT